MDLKTWLLQYSEQARYVDLLIERATALEEQIRSPRTSKIDGMPHGSGGRYDAIGSALAKLESLKTQINAEREKEMLLYQERDQVIEQITGKRWMDWRAVLKMRYLDGAAWNNICCTMFGSRDDYEYKQESYQRRTFSLHKEALRELSKIYLLQGGRKEE